MASPQVGAGARPDAPGAGAPTRQSVRLDLDLMSPQIVWAAGMPDERQHPPFLPLFLVE